MTAVNNDGESVDDRILPRAAFTDSFSLSLSQDDFLFSVSIVSGLLCIALAVIKFMLGRVLTSRALITDGNTDAGTIRFTLFYSAE